MMTWTKQNTFPTIYHRFVGPPHRLNDASNFTAGWCDAHGNEMWNSTYREMLSLSHEDLTISHSLVLMEHGSPFPGDTLEFYCP